MTFKELEQKIGTQNESEWHQHKNGGGWVRNGAKIDDSACIGEGAIVFSGNARYDYAQSGSREGFGMVDNNRKMI